MSELILPGAGAPPTEVFYIVDDKGKETAVPTSELWAFEPDAWRGITTYLDMSNLPKEEREQQGDNDE